MRRIRLLLLVVAILSIGLSVAWADGRAEVSLRTGEVLETLALANSAARHEPTRSGFQEARHVYSYEPGAIYEIYASPDYVSTILLEPGETLNSIAAGDTSRWLVTQAETETNAEARTLVLVKPQTGALRTNIVLITDRRTYLVEAVSQSGNTYSAQIAWTYPRSDPAEPTPVIDARNLNYRIQTTRGQTPIWSPTRVFDDGRRTWIEFDPQVAASDLPPLFVVTAQGVEIVNYRVQGQRYVVDRIFDVAELRLGTRAQTIVRIERNPAPQPSIRPLWRHHP